MGGFRSNGTVAVPFIKIVCTATALDPSLYICSYDHHPSVISLKQHHNTKHKFA